MNGIIALVLVGPNAVKAESLGRHFFASLPRIGEHITVDDQGRAQVLKVNGVTHFGEAQDESDRPMGIVGATVQLICEEI